MFLQRLETTQISFKCKSRHASQLLILWVNCKIKIAIIVSFLFLPFFHLFLSIVFFFNGTRCGLLTSRLSPKLKLRTSSVKKTIDPMSS